MNGKNVFILEINDYLLNIESIINKYIKLPNGLIFVNGVRLPVIDKTEVSNLIEKGLISRVPSMPYISAYLFKDIFLNTIIDNNPERELLYINKVTGCIDRVYDMPDNLTPIDIIYSFINNISEADVDAILSLVNSIIFRYIHIVEASPYSIYEINVDSQYLILKRLDDIRVYRYKQLLTGAEYDT